MDRASLWRNGDFLRLWSGQAVSELGTWMGGTALGVAAVIVLHATPLQLGALVATSSAGVLASGFVAGAWTDRLRKRPIMIAADTGRALAYGTVPAAAFLGVLRIEQLYAVALVAAVLGSFFDVAYRSYLPSLLPPRDLHEGNSKLALSASIGEVAGPTIGGGLVQLVTAPVTILVDALSFVVSAVSIALIRSRTETPARPAAMRIGVRREIGDGLRVVWHLAPVRALFLSTLTSWTFSNFFASLYTFYVLTELHLEPALLGLAISAGGVGSLTAPFLAGPLTRRFGLGPTLIGARLASKVLGILTAVAGGPPLVAFTLILIPQLFGDGLHTIYSINAITLRQSVTPPAFLGRVNAADHVLLEGIAPLGALLGALVAEAYGVRTAVWFAVLGGFPGVLYLVFTPVARMKATPAAA